MAERTPLVPAFWRTQQQRYSLIGDVCSNGHVHFPPDDVCKRCDPEKAVGDAIAANSIKMAREMQAHIEKIAEERRISSSSG